MYKLCQELSDICQWDEEEKLELKWVPSDGYEDLQWHKMLQNVPTRQQQKNC